MKKLFTLFTFLAFLFMGNALLSQARIVSNGGAFIVMDEGASGNGVYLVVENGNPDALAPSNGAPDLNIVSENENNIIKWFLGPLNTGVNYQVPFANTSGDYTRVVMNFPNAAAIGTIGSNFYGEFATYGTASTNLPLPSEVNHLTNLNTAIGSPGTQANTANDLNTVDRFWFMEFFDYSVHPSPNLRFSPAPAEWGAPNSITTSNIMVQRFNPNAGPNGQWADWLSNPTSINTGTATTTNIQPPSAEFYKTWTLTSFDQPLSVELLNFEAQCENDRSLVEWSTASELNSDFFSVERSIDGLAWETIGEVQAAGNSSSTINYSFYDENAKNGINYYQIIENDLNGDKTSYGPVSASCGSNVFEIVNVNNDYSANGQIDIILNTSEDKMADIKIIDITGKLVFQQSNELIQEGISTVSLNKNDLSMGVYFIAVQSSDELLTRKVVLN